jgi:hypothetical protein
VSANVSELAFENAVIQISYTRNGRGFIINMLPKRVILSPESGPETRRILGSPLQWNAQTNNINVLRSTGALPEVVETPYLVDKDNYFIQTTEQDKDNGQGFTFWERSAVETREDSNWSNQASLIALWFRCAASIVDFRCGVRQRWRRRSRRVSSLDASAPGVKNRGPFPVERGRLAA